MVAIDFDDLVLSVQRAIDRLVRRLRRGTAPEITRRRLLIVQIDGLSRAVLEQGLTSGYLPFLRRLLRRHGYTLQPMTVGVPTSTPAFQMATMYGVRPDIPGFHYFDRGRQSDVHFPRRGHAATVEAEQAAGRHGILEGGSAYGCVFTGGAENNLFTFASLTRPSGRGVLAALSPLVVLVWVFLKSLVRTVAELTRAAPRFATRSANDRQGWRWFMIKVGFSIWMRELFTMAASRDLYAGVPALYVNFIDYDEASHNFGPRSRPALITLRRVDRAIRQLWRVMRRIPEHQYDLYVLADHGQVACRAYRDVSGGLRFERWIFDELLEPTALPPPEGARSGLVRGIRERRQEAPELFQHYLNYADEDFVRCEDPEAHEQDGVRVISAGPNAFLYVLGREQPMDIDALDGRFPGVAEKLSRSTGVGLVLARSANGPVCFWRGTRYALADSAGGPFAGRADASTVAKAMTDLMAMPSAGDLVIYGIDSPEGNVSFIPEVGCHAGPSHDEMHTFILRPANVVLPSPIHDPVQLYDHFIGYRVPDPAT